MDSSLPAGDVHGGPGLAKLQGDAAADTAAGAGDEGDAAGKRGGHFDLRVSTD